MPPRTIAIGDIHGCRAALDTLLDAIRPRAKDTIVALGDYIDRGYDSRGVIDRLLDLRARCRLVPLLGNHEQMFLEALINRSRRRAWLEFGGIATLASYGDDLDFGAVPAEHVDFLESCLEYYETPTHLFLHANYGEGLPLAEQSDYHLRWESLRDRVPGPHVSGKTAVVGHTSQKSGEVLDLGHLVCIDTYCHGGGWLTGLDVGNGRIWQADASGLLRVGS
jgi:serine/threonine protein phosphatase 1